MKRLLIAGGFLALGLVLTIVSFLGRSDSTRHENMVRDRGQTETQDPRQSLNRGRLGTQPSMPVEAQTWTGMLVDAGCPIRDAIATQIPPQQEIAQAPSPSGQLSPSAAGRLDTEAERAGAQQHLVPDVRSRQEDMSCSVTALTRGFALVLPDGRLKNLDEGGNTWAIQAFQGTPAGQAVLNGHAPGAKPRAAITGHMLGDRIVVESLRLI